MPQRRPGGTQRPRAISAQDSEACVAAAIGPKRLDLGLRDNLARRAACCGAHDGPLPINSVRLCDPISPEVHVLFNDVNGCFRYVAASTDVDRSGTAGHMSDDRTSNRCPSRASKSGCREVGEVGGQHRRTGFSRAITLRLCEGTHPDHVRRFWPPRRKHRS